VGNKYLNSYIIILAIEPYRLDCVLFLRIKEVLVAIPLYGKKLKRYQITGSNIKKSCDCHGGGVRDLHRVLSNFSVFAYEGWITRDGSGSGAKESATTSSVNYCVPFAISPCADPDQHNCSDRTQTFQFLEIRIHIIAFLRSCVVIP
jgi:hypothetical protein